MSESNNHHTKAPLSGMPPMQANKQLLNKFSSSMSLGTTAMQSNRLHVIGRKYGSQGYELEVITSKEGTLTPISYAKIVQPQEPVFCVLEKKRKAAHEDVEMDPEIHHLIDTFWKVDNCPPPLLGEITLELLQKKDKQKTRASPRKLKRVYKISDLFSGHPGVHSWKF